MAYRCGPPSQDPPSFFNCNDQRAPFIAEGNDLFERERTEESDRAQNANEKPENWRAH